MSAQTSGVARFLIRLAPVTALVLCLASLLPGQAAIAAPPAAVPCAEPELASVAAPVQKQSDCREWRRFRWWYIFNVTMSAEVWGNYYIPSISLQPYIAEQRIVNWSSNQSVYLRTQWFGTDPPWERPPGSWGSGGWGTGPACYVDGAGIEHCGPSVSIASLNPNSGYAQHWADFGVYTLNPNQGQNWYFAFAAWDMLGYGFQTQQRRVGFVGGSQDGNGLKTQNFVGYPTR